MKTHDNGQRTTDNGQRLGFTLIELLVVMAIIAVLASLISAAVFSALKNAEVTRASSDISQLSTSLESFKSKFSLKRYPPSQIRLRENGAYTTTNALDVESARFIQEWWPRITYPVDWNGDGVANQVHDLQGDQALVFWLGGIPRGTPPVPAGFSVDPRNPALATGDQIQPFFEFRTNRLTARAAGSRFLSYTDAYNKRPYAYFSAYRAGNDYMNDCPALGVTPYFETGTGTSITNPRRYFKPDSFQIISAGRDGVFGPGGAWSPRNASSINANGRDDQSSFHDSLMGVTRN